VFALLLAAPSISLPEDDLGIRRFQTPPLGEDVRLSQTFTMTGDGLHAIELSAAPSGEAVSGGVRFELYDRTLEAEDARVPVRSAEVTAADLVKTSSYQFEFAPILDSKDRVYRLDLVSSSEQPARGVAFWATKGERYRHGALMVNNQARWADLAFRTEAPAPSRWRLLMTLRRTNPIRAYAVMAGLVATWVGLGIALRAIPNIPVVHEERRA
jgi:hypothetical protein